MNSQLIFRNLDVSPRAVEIAEKIFHSSDQKMFNASVRAILENIFNYDDMCLAGRLLIYEVVRAIPNVKTYMILNQNRLAPRMIKFMTTHLPALETLVKNAEYYNYDNHDFFSANTLCKTFLFKASANHKPTETPVLKNLRVAIETYWDYADKSSSRSALSVVAEYFDELNHSMHTPASPTIFNAGTEKPQMASCFLGGVEDDLDSMMNLWKIMGTISRHNGAFGFSVNRIRHSAIAGTGQSSGVIGYLRANDRVVEYVDQGGKRKGAAAAYLNPWHIDVEDFIKAVDNFTSHEMRFHNLNNAVWMHDLLYERIYNDEEWTLFCPKTVKSLQDKYGQAFEDEYVKLEKLAVERDGELAAAEEHYLDLRHRLEEDSSLEELYLEAYNGFQKALKSKIVYKKVMAKDIMNLICDIQLKSGKPYVMNGDRCNYKSNHKNIGAINNSNLCAEIVEYSDSKTIASCNLSSLNLPKYVTRRFNHKLSTSLDGPDSLTVSDEEIMAELREAFNFNLLGKMTRSVTRNLNQIIDKNYYPLSESEIKKPNFDTRPLGIGVQGLDDAFKVLDIAYMSREAMILNKMIFACMYYNAILQSVELAKVDGEYPLYRTGSYQRWDDTTKTYVTMYGSPMSNGQFQFDLWQEEYLMDLHRDRIRAPYDPKDNIPINPSQWGQNQDFPVQTLAQDSFTAAWQNSLSTAFNTLPSRNADAANLWGITREQSEIVHSWDWLREQVMTHGVRNSLFLAIMPTATTAHILRNAEGIEAHQSNFYSRQVLSGNYTVVNRHLYSDLKEIGLFNKRFTEAIFDNRGSLLGLTDLVNKYPDMCPPDALVDGVLKPELGARLRFLEEKYRGMFEINMTHYLIMARQRGIYICQTQSTNAYMVNPPLEHRMAYHAIAHALHLKTCQYYLRNSVETVDSGFNKTITSLAQERIGQDGEIVKAAAKQLNEIVPMCRMEEGCVSCSA